MTSYIKRATVGMINDTKILYLWVGVKILNDEM